MSSFESLISKCAEYRRVFAGDEAQLAIVDRFLREALHLRLQETRTNALILELAIEKARESSRLEVYGRKIDGNFPFLRQHDENG